MQIPWNWRGTRLKALLHVTGFEESCRAWRCLVTALLIATVKSFRIALKNHFLSMSASLSSTSNVDR